MYDVIIIGAGPAGLTAGLYAGRFRMKAVIIEKISAGGQIVLSPSIENYPGFPGGVATGELMHKFQEQVREVGVDESAGHQCGVVAALHEAVRPQQVLLDQGGHLVKPEQADGEHGCEQQRRCRRAGGEPEECVHCRTLPSQHPGQTALRSDPNLIAGSGRW